jgi:hypothetical protein
MRTETVLLLAIAGVGLYGWHAGWFANMFPGQAPAAPGGGGQGTGGPQMIPSVTGPIDLATGRFGPNVPLPQGGTATNAAQWIF